MFYIVIDFIFIRNFYLSSLEIVSMRFIYIYCIYLLIYLWYLFMTFIYLFIYLFIRKLYLLEVTLIDWIIKLKRSIINVLLQMVYFQKAFNVSDMEDFIYPSMFCQFIVYYIVEEPHRIFLLGTLELSTLHK